MQSLSPISVPPQLATPELSSKSIQASRDFEASLISSLLQTAEKTFAALPGESSFAGSENYDYVATEALGNAIAAHGGFGIASMISHYLAVHGTQSSSQTDAPPGREPASSGSSSR